jgi:hypothetical protein
MLCTCAPAGGGVCVRHAAHLTWCIDNMHSACLRFPTVCKPRGDGGSVFILVKEVGGSCGIGGRPHLLCIGMLPALCGPMIEAW